MQAFTSDGQQLWQTALNSGCAGLSVPDGFGGMIVSTACDGPNSIPLTLNDINSQGGSNWSAQITSSTPGVCPPATPKIAIGQDGAVVVANVTQVSPPLAILDGQSGAALSLPAIPASTFINSFGEPTTCDCLSILGQPIVDSDGSTYVEYEVRTVQFWSTGASTTNSSALYLLKLAPDYTTATTLQLTSATLADVFPSTIIPDGNGGVLATWTVVDSFDPNTNTTPFAPQPYQAAYVSGGAIAATYQLPNSPTGQLLYGADHLPLAPQLVLGENGTAFASYGSNVTSFQLPSGSPNWNYQGAPQTSLTVIASVAGNSFAAKSTDASGLDTIVRMDPSGVATLDGWSASDISNYGGSLWMGLSSAGISGFSNSPLQLSVSPWYGSDGNGGHTSIQNVSVPDFSQSGANQTAIADVLQKILNALPNDPVCSNWLQAGGNGQGNGAQQIEIVLQANNFGHGSIHQGNSIAYQVGAFSGNLNPDKTKIPGVPLSAVFTVNDAGAFFNQFAGGDRTKPFEVGKRSYSGNTARAQATILIHETAHQITVAGFQPDFGNGKAERTNDAAVDKNCRQLIEGLQ